VCPNSGVKGMITKQRNNVLMANTGEKFWEFLFRVRHRRILCWQEGARSIMTSVGSLPISEFSKDARYDIIRIQKSIMWKDFSSMRGGKMKRKPSANISYRTAFIARQDQNRRLTPADLLVEEFGYPRFVPPIPIRDPVERL
jgi:hypothetical protein